MAKPTRPTRPKGYYERRGIDILKNEPPEDAQVITHAQLEYICKALEYLIKRLHG
jgi:hypothetical protein